MSLYFNFMMMFTQMKGWIVIPFTRLLKHYLKRISRFVVTGDLFSDCEIGRQANKKM